MRWRLSTFPTRAPSEPSVESVVSLLPPEHDIRVDYKLRGGDPWQQRSVDELRASDVVLVFVSQATQTSAFQNAEIGAARFCANFFDNKAILPVRIDDAGCQTLDDYRYVNATHRDPAGTARKIADEMAGCPVACGCSSATRIWIRIWQSGSWM